MSALSLRHDARMNASSEYKRALRVTRPSPCLSPPAEGSVLSVPLSVLSESRTICQNGAYHTYCLIRYRCAESGFRC